MSFRTSNDDNSPWKQNAEKRKHSNSVMQNTIQWAGEQHKRPHFKKGKDFLGEWTNVLFRS